MFSIIFILQICCFWVDFLTCPSQPLEGALCLLFFLKTPHVFCLTRHGAFKYNQVKILVLCINLLCIIYTFYLIHVANIAILWSRVMKESVTFRLHVRLTSVVFVLLRVRLRSWMLLFSKQSSQR